MAKDKDYIKLIHSARWVELRKRKLTANPLCQDCEENGTVSPAREVHHVVPVEEGLSYMEKARLMFDMSNLRALCHNCHIEAHVRLGRCGKEANRQRSDRQLEAIRRRYFGE